MYSIGVLCAVVALGAFFEIHRSSGTGSLNEPFRITSAAQARRFDALSGAQVAQPRLYPYSVIPGGVRSAQELRNAIAHDPVVAELYAQFDVSKARVMRLTKSREVYVSYRLGDHIYWTKKRLLLRAGETVITDGKHEARTRCGNRISATPVQPVFRNEPKGAAMDVPPAVPLFAEKSETLPYLPLDSAPVDPGAPALPAFPEPPSPPQVYYIPPPDFPIIGGGPPSFPNVIPPPPPPVSTPEPGALSMLGLGLLVLATSAGIATVRKLRNC
jgi:hypothetical protein